jgi:hypothetical protein
MVVGGLGSAPVRAGRLSVAVELGQMLAVGLIEADQRDVVWDIDPSGPAITLTGQPIPSIVSSKYRHIRGSGCAHKLCHRRVHIRMQRVARMAQGDGQVVQSNQHPAHTLHMPVKQRLAKGVRGSALQDPRDMAKAGLLAAQSPAVKVTTHRNDA